MLGQFIFELDAYDNFKSEDYFVSPSNIDAVNLINLFPNWHNNGIVIIGGEKSGKTHLGHIWKEKSNANFFDFKKNTNLNKIDAKKNNIFDNFQLIKEENEKDFFQIYNNIINNNYYIVFLTSSDLPVQLKLNDLKSRFESLTKVSISPPDDQLIQAMLLKFFHDNQINIAPDVVSFTVSRVSRDYKEIHLFLDKINQLSLEHKSKISIPFLNKFFTF